MCSENFFPFIYLELTLLDSQMKETEKGINFHLLVKQASVITKINYHIHSIAISERIQVLFPFFD
jgi:hypothetical protein